MKKIIAVVALLIAVIGMAHMIEVNARPETGREGVRVEGEAGPGGGGGGMPAGHSAGDGHNH